MTIEVIIWVLTLMVGAILLVLRARSSSNTDERTPRNWRGESLDPYADDDTDQAES